MNDRPSRPRPTRAPTSQPPRKPDPRGKRPEPNMGAPRRNAGGSDLKNNLSSQTPLNRRMQQKKKAPAEPGTMRRTSKPQYFRVKDKKKNNKMRSNGASVFFARLLAVLIGYAVLMPLSLLLAALWLPHHNTPETSDYVYQVGPDKNYYSKKVLSWKTVRNGDQYYLNMTELADFCDLTTTGDERAIRYIVKETGETVELVIGQSVAYVNGLQERTGADTLLKNGVVYASMDFVDHCFDGITVTLDTEKNKITVLRDTDENGDPAIVSFPYKPAAATDSIRFAELDTDLQLQILIQNRPPVPETEGDTVIPPTVEDGTATPEA